MFQAIFYSLFDFDHDYHVTGYVSAEFWHENENILTLNVI